MSEGLVTLGPVELFGAVWFPVLGRAMPAAGKDVDNREGVRRILFAPRSALIPAMGSMP